MTPAGREGAPADLIVSADELRVVDQIEKAGSSSLAYAGRAE
jgi:hypothetical protein